MASWCLEEAGLQRGMLVCVYKQYWLSQQILLSPAPANEEARWELEQSACSNGRLTLCWGCCCCYYCMQSSWGLPVHHPWLLPYRHQHTTTCVTDTSATMTMDWTASLYMSLHLKMKCFSRYLPYIFRPPNTILSSSCHTEGRDQHGGGWSQRMLLLHCHMTAMGGCMQWGIHSTGSYADYLSIGHYPGWGF